LALVLQILVLLTVLVGLVSIILCVKNWHWAQMLLLLAIYFSAIGTLILGLEVFRIHRNYRKGMPRLEQQLAETNAEIEALKSGTRDQAVIGRISNRQENGLPFAVEDEGRFPGIDVWAQRLRDFHRQRGRAWRGATPAGAVDAATGRIAVAVPNPKPHGIEKDAILYAFEGGEPNAADPQRGGQYLGEFRVVESNADGVVLESIQRLDNRTGGRLDMTAQSGRPWSLYETMPADRYELFAGYSEEELRKMFPAASVEEYVRHGKPVTEDDDQYHRAGFDEAGLRVGPEDKDKVAEERYDRPLRDYAYLFSELAREKTILQADRASLLQVVSRLKKANDDAKKLSALRTEQKKMTQSDLDGMQGDLAAIRSLQAAVGKQLANAEKLLGDALRFNEELAEGLRSRQLGMLPASAVSAPAGGALLNEPAGF
jgi:hypothetical protein